jgi:hypothetical protein
MANLKPFDPQSVIDIILTVVLFAAALFVKGFTHVYLLRPECFSFP